MRSHDYYRNFIHRLIAVFLPASFLVSFVLLAVGLLSAAFTLPRYFYSILCIALPLLSLAAGLTAVLLGNIFQQERVSWTARLREWMILSLIVYSLASLFKSGTLSYRFIPSPSNILSVLYASGQWVSSVLIQKALRDREILVLELEGREGFALYSAMRDAGVQPGAALQSLVWLRGLATSFAAVLLALLVPTANGGVSLSVPAIISVVYFFGLYVFILVLCSQYGFEQFAAGAGLREKDSQRTARLRFAAILIVTAGVAGFFCGGFSVSLSSQWILLLVKWFWVWLRSFIPEGGIGIKIRPRSDASPEEGMRELIPYGEGGADVPGFLDALTRSARVTIIFLLIVFVIAPLLWKKYRIFLGRYSIQGFFRHLLTYLRVMFGKKTDPEDNGVLIDPDNVREVRKRLGAMSRPDADKIKRKEFGRVSRAFLRLIRWGNRQGLVFTNVTAPGSYALKLSERFPGHKETIAFVADCFEQAVYSPLPLGKERLGEYECAVRNIVRQK